MPVFDGLDLAAVPAARLALDTAAVEGQAILSDALEPLPRSAMEAYPSLATGGVAVAVPVYRDYRRLGDPGTDR